MKVLFVAYYFDPYPGVGAKRISYWANNINRYFDEYEFDVVTATSSEETRSFEGNVYYVEDKGGSLLSKVFKTDRGASWLPNLRSFLNDHLEKKVYDVVVITGNPFLHFFILDLFRNKGIKTIIDFRDPFATNPRGLNLTSFSRKLKDYILRKIELYFVKRADRIITVNEFCCKLISGYSRYAEKFKIIDNGYDEIILNKIPINTYRSKERISFGYAGSLYNDRNPTNFLKLISNNERTVFNHIGSHSEFLKNNTSKNVVQHGQKSYIDTLQILNECDVCLIFTSGFPFESTTKIFDYIALEKIILIITEGEVERGAIHDITKDYPNVIWSKNNSDEISLAILKITNEYKISPYPDKVRFSRNFGLGLLVKEIKKLTDSN